MDLGEIIKTAGPIATGLGGALVALAKWYGSRSASREERDEKRADTAQVLLVDTLNRRIVSLELQVAQLMAESCLVKGCLERRTRVVP